MTPVQAIRKFCCDCQGGNQKAPALCTNPDCALYAFREGKNPARKGIGGGRRLKRNGETIIGSRVARTEKIIEVRGNKRIRIITEDI